MVESALEADGQSQVLQFPMRFRALATSLYAICAFYPLPATIQNSFGAVNVETLAILTSGIE